jgi:phospholipid transport system substrate-binding protein
MKNWPEIKSALHLLIVTAMLLYVPVVWTQELDTTDPAKTVTSLQSSLLKGMQGGDKLGFQGRFKLLAPIVERSHDLDFIAKTILGKHWTKLNREQQQIFISHFHKLSISTYAGWFKEYNGEHFKFIDQKTMPRKYVLVRSQLIQSNGDTVSFDYLLRQDKKDWRIINILADGVSDLALKRVEYRSILEQKGFKVFINMLKKKIELAEKN